MRPNVALALILALAGCGSSETPQAGVDRRNAEDKVEAEEAAAAASAQANSGTAAATSRGVADGKAASEGFDAMEKAEKAKN